MSAAGAQTIGKKALVVALGWTRPTLDRRLKTDPLFPVEKRGTQQGGWEFNEAKVREYLGGPVSTVLAPPASKAPAIDKAQLRDAVRPPAAAPSAPPSRRSAHHTGEATARQRKDNAEASLKENKLRLENGELVWRSDMRQAAADVFASLGNNLDSLADQIAKKLQMPDAVPQIEELIDRLRTDMVEQARKLLDG